MTENSNKLTIYSEVNIEQQRARTVYTWKKKTITPLKYSTYILTVRQPSGAQEESEQASENAHALAWKNPKIFR